MLRTADTHTFGRTWNNGIILYFIKKNSLAFYDSSYMVVGGWIGQNSSNKFVSSNILHSFGGARFGRFLLLSFYTFLLQLLLLDLASGQHVLAGVFVRNVAIVPTRAGVPEFGGKNIETLDIKVLHPSFTKYTIKKTIQKGSKYFSLSQLLHKNEAW